MIMKCMISDKTSNFVFWGVFLVIPLVLVVTSAASSPLEIVPSKTITVNIGDPTEFTCKANKKLKYCLIKTSKSENLNFDSVTSQSGRFSYAGKGLDSGDCGLKISRATKDDDGVFECRVLITGNEDDEIAIVTVTVASAPEQPELSLDKPSYKDGETMHATCIIRNGRPAANNVMFNFDGKPKPGTSKQPSEHSATGDSLPTFTVESSFSQRVTWKDNGKKLKCSASHHSWSSSPESSSEEELYIDFKAIRETKGSIQHYIDTSPTGMEQSINVTFFASPKPKSLSWHIDDLNFDEGRSNNMYHAMNLQTIKLGEYEARLRLLNVTSGFEDKTFKLTVINAEGSSSFSGTITSKKTPTPTPVPVPPETGPGIGLILGIIFGFILTLGIVGGVLFVLKRRQQNNLML